MSRRKRARRGVCEVEDGDWAVGGLVATSWRALLASPDAEEQLERALAYARAAAAEGSDVHARIAAELERDLAALRAEREGHDERLEAD